jgi:DMSO reductase anchor subunit
MHPAPSVIIFTVLSGLGFGYLAFLGTLLHPEGWTAFALWGLGYALAVGGLLASAFHLGNPQRALRAFTQWRSSWLSREAWVSVLALVALAPLALSDWLGLCLPRALGWLGAGLCLLAVLCTSMIYAQIRAVPRWHHPSVPALFLSLSVAGGALLAGQETVALPALALAGAAMGWHWWQGDGAFARAGSSLGTATGLGRIGAPAVFELPHTGSNYLMKEMIHVVGRRHAHKLRGIALLLAVLAPFAIALAGLGPVTTALSVTCYLTGAFAQRWLFFAEAEHVVGLYYGAHAVQSVLQPRG